MIVHEPAVREHGDEVVVEAELELAHPAGAARPTLWFAFPRRLAADVDRRADGFAAALLPLAMRLGEPLEMRGELSARLLGGMREYQQVQCAWKPDFFHRVEVRAEAVVRRDPAGSAGVAATSFSGGVDSFYTLLRHLPEHEPYPSYRAGCCLMINGFDGDAFPDDPAAFARLAGVYEPVMASHGLDLVVVRTNLLRVLGPFVRQQSFGAFLTAPALVLGRRLSRLFIPSGCKVTTMGLFPDGSHLMLDHLLSSETLEVIHDSPELTRVEKTVELAKWPETYDRLRVCHRATGVSPDGTRITNCCACEKCIRTMVTLEAAGALSRFGSFPIPLERGRIRAADFRTAASRLFAEEAIAHAARAGRRDLARDLRVAVARSVWFWPRMGAVAVASHRLERRSAAYARLVAAPKRALKRAGWGRRWLY